MQISLRDISSIFIRRQSKILKEINSNSFMDKWLARNPSPISLDTREDLYEYINDLCCKRAPIDYLEFGVAHGFSLMYWLNLNKNNQSKFYGFDTFEGLPEPFDRIKHTDPIGEFSNDGEYPKIEDDRVRFVKGLFQDTLQTFLSTYTPNNRLIVHNDSDLYSSSLYLLTRLNDFLITGSIIIFDEFFFSSHEFQAFYDYTISYRRSYEVLASSPTEKRRFTQVAIQFL